MSLVSNQCSVRDSSTMDECFELLQYAISSEVKETKTRFFSYDPLRELVDRLKEKLETCGWEVSEVSCEDLTQENVPSTSIAEGENENVIDTRIRFSALLNLLFDKLSSAVKQVSERSSDSTTVLSVERMATLTSALQFYVPTAILPYIDEGVTFAVEQRCTFVKYWQPLRVSNNFRRKQLLNAAQTLLRLSTCCHQIKQLIATKFLGDFIALNEQLLNLNETVMKQHYEAFILHDICRSDLMYQFVSMMNPLSVARKKMASPRWFTMSLGRRMSEMVMEANGLANLTTALLHEGDANFENSKFVQLLADVISRRPQFLDQGDTRRALYHVNILKQFINLMQRHPAAAKIASWFAASVEAIAAVVPQTAAVCFTDKLLHPWEILFDRNGKMQLWEEGWNRRLDDSFQVLLFYVRGLSPATSMQPVCRMKKLFPLWLSMLGSALYASEQITDIGRSSACKLFTGDLSQLLKRILMDPIFDSDVQRAHFLLKQLVAKVVQMRVEFAFNALIVEVDASGESETNERKLQFGFVRIRAVPDAGCAQAKARAFDNVVKAIVHLLKSMEKDVGERLAMKVLSECVQLTRGKQYSDDEQDGEDRFVTIDGHDHASEHIQDRMRVQYLMGCLGEMFAEINVEFEETLICMAGVAEAIIESTNQKLEDLQSKANLDVQVASKEEDGELEGVEVKSVETAIALAGVVTAGASDSVKVKVSLSSLGAALKRFCLLWKSTNGEKLLKFSTAFSSANEVLSIFKNAAVEMPSVITTGGSSSPTVGTNLREAKLNKLEGIIRDMDDPAEAIRGHALIELARGIRRRDRPMIDAIGKNTQLMGLVMKKAAERDSYVYLTAIRAMAELAYWKNEYLEAMLEFFIDPYGKLSALLSGTEYEQIEATDKRDFLLIQRVKVAEALCKVFKALGEMAPWHFDRLIDPLMSLVMHADDEQLKASCVCAIADLVMACRGRRISAHLNEMLLMVEQLLDSAKESLLRRAAMVLLRAIIVSFDVTVVEGLSFHLRDLNRHLRHLLVMDRDDGVRLLAELCLLDIKEQMDSAVRDLENSMFKRIRLD